MSYTGDPANSLSDRIRLTAGDTALDEEGLSDSEYEYLISLKTMEGITNEPACSIQALEYLLAKYATCVDETAGKLSVKYSQLYDQYSKLLDRYSKDPRTALYKVGVPFAGGIYRDEVCENKDNTNTISSPLTKGWSTDDYSTYS